MRILASVKAPAIFQSRGFDTAKILILSYEEYMPLSSFIFQAWTKKRSTS